MLYLLSIRFRIHVLTCTESDIISEGGSRLHCDVLRNSVLCHVNPLVFICILN
jgi:hypothetical protein